MDVVEQAQQDVGVGEECVQDRGQHSHAHAGEGQHRVSTTHTCLGWLRRRQQGSAQGAHAVPAAMQTPVLGAGCSGD